MKNLIPVIIALSLIACGPSVRDKKPSSFNNSDSSSAATNGSTTGEDDDDDMVRIITDDGDTNGSTNGDVGSNNDSPDDPSNNDSPDDPTNNDTSDDPDDPTNNDSPDDPSNNDSPDDPDDPDDPVDPDAEIRAKCDDFCDVVWGRCVTQSCSLDSSTEQLRSDTYANCTGPATDSTSCIYKYKNDSQYASTVDTYANASCSNDDVRKWRCLSFGTDQCSCAVPDLGGPCMSDSDCDATAGELTGFCAMEDFSTGANPGGQCLAGGCEFGDAEAGQLLFGPGTGCGDNACYVIDQSNSACLDVCTQNSDCDRYVTGPNQSGYSCTILGVSDINGSPGPWGICQTACSTDSDCDAGQVCGATWSCEFECTSDADCGGELSCTGTSSSGKSYCAP